MVKTTIEMIFYKNGYGAKIKYLDADLMEFIPFSHKDNVVIRYLTEEFAKLTFDETNEKLEQMGEW